MYHPFDHKEQTEFYDELDGFFSQRPRNLELLVVAEVNFNLGVQTPMFKDVLGTFGIDNLNQKGKDILYLLNSNNLNILLSYFQHANYVTYRTFSPVHSPHMLDNFMCCANFFKRVTVCKTTTSGAQSDHSAIRVNFKLTSIKLNTDKAEKIVIDWKTIREDTYTNKVFNCRLHCSLMEQDIFYFEPTNGNDYTSFNQLILHAAQTTATKPKFEKKGWFHFSKDALLPAISRRDKLLHSLRTVTFQATQYLKQALTSAQ